ncbi:MAG: hypothetical protein DCC75_13870 [Proteobacteria bacterium]|nr:MAG: hypothetical protein DCC75_13870 [Pseudomonadota bacterium]
MVFPAFRPNGRSVVFLAVQGGMIPIIETGDTLPGQSSPVQLATVSRESINNARQIALTVRLQNETELVIRLDPDGIVFPDDQCPTDNTKFEAGICGCGVSDADSNTDGLLDCLVTPRLYQLTDELNKQMRKLRRLASSAPKKAKKKQRQLIRGINQGLREALYLADTSAGQIKLKSVNISALKLAKKMRSAVKKGLKTSNSDFGRNKSKAMKAIRKFRNSLLIS